MTHARNFLQAGIFLEPSWRLEPDGRAPHCAHHSHRLRRRSIGAVKVERRKIITYSLASAGAAGLAGALGYREWQRLNYVPTAHGSVDHPGIFAAAGTRVTAQRRLGRTNLQVSVVGI